MFWVIVIPIGIGMAAWAASGHIRKTEPGPLSGSGWLWIAFALLLASQLP